MAYYNEPFEIKKHLGVIAEHRHGWTKELNFISWNGDNPKYDIRVWSSNHKHMSRGITLTKAEMKRVVELMEADND